MPKELAVPNSQEEREHLGMFDVMMLVHDEGNHLGAVEEAVDLPVRYVVEPT